MSENPLRKGVNLATFGALFFTAKRTFLPKCLLNAFSSTQGLNNVRPKL